MEILRCATHPDWAPQAVLHLDQVLCDHAHCEKKAAAQALSLINQYSHHPQLVAPLIGLAQEELRHFRQVHRYIVRRGLRLQRDRGDPYVRCLLTALRANDPERLVDRLLLNSLVEARSCERLALLGAHLPDGAMAQFYQSLARAEAGHFRLFVKLAYQFADRDSVDARLEELAQIEAQIVQQRPIEPRIH